MPVEKIEPGAPESQSADLLADNLARLRALFPELLTERQVDGRTVPAVNVDVLKSLVGDATVTDADEKYGLNWHGKRAARQLALTPSTGTLRPCRDESVDWDTTQNLMIEGDNLEVLKLLQKSYAGKVKLIYIDPPYNTGKDFVYPDNFQDSIKNYLELTGQVEGGRKIASNTEASGRFHTDWLSMLYPRLVLARNLLRDDGALFVSIDDGEVDNLKKLGAEVFGEECFVGIVSVLVNPRGRHLDKYIAQTHDNLVIFVKNPDVEGSIFGAAKEGAMLEEYDKEDAKGKYRELGLRNRNQAFNPITRPKLFYPLYVNPTNGKVSLERTDNFTDEVLPITAEGVKTCWTWGKEKVEREAELLTASQVTDGTWRVFRKDYLNGADGEVASTLAKSIWLDKEFNNDYGRKAIKELLGAPVIDFPKSPQLIQRIVSIASAADDVVLDFFAGSGTTAHAVMLQNVVDGGARRFLLVQLPEPVSADVKEQRVAAEFCESIGRPGNIAEVTKERVRRAARAVAEDTPVMEGEPRPDRGFRAFRLGTSNIKPWAPRRDDLAPTLLDHLEHIESSRSDEDLLYELLIKLGLDLCVPIAAQTVAGKNVHAIGGGVLMTCLDKSITVADAEPLALGIAAWRKVLDPAGDVTCVFRDSAFENDVAKTNLAAILEQHGIAKVRSL